VGRQNIYDDPSFFGAYQGMRDTATGINEAIEQPALRALLPDVAGARVVDLGCGDGQLSRELAGAGAASVLGIDPSERMLTLAATRTTPGAVTYQQAFAEDVDLPAAGVDLVVSSLAFHYVADLGALIDRIAGWLRPGGLLVASMEHPVKTAAPELGVLDRYADEGRRDTSWFVDGVVKYHRTVATVVAAVVDAGLVLERLVEPRPTAEALAARPDLEKHLRFPPLLLVRAARPELSGPAAL
jgi:2-polyprenyl-3-methyl-5-hydroxy-6-metoxy-1,4-benzoquinol methylase